MDRPFGIKGGLRDTRENPQAGERSERTDEEPAGPPSGHHGYDAG
jgi:hypothetical protein